MVPSKLVLFKQGIIVNLDFDFLLTWFKVTHFLVIHELEKGPCQIDLRLLSS